MRLNEWAPGDRTIDTFSDEIITRATSSGGSVLDCGFLTWVSDPDFAASGNRTQCAAHIRRNAAGEDIRQKSKGPKLYPPYDCLTGYDLRYRLMRHWDRKERMQAVGLDPDAEYSRACANGWERWDTNGKWLDSCQIRRHAEFLFVLLVAEQEARISNSEVEADAARQEVAEAMQDELASMRRGMLTPEGLEAMQLRLSTELCDPDPSLSL